MKLLGIGALFPLFIPRIFVLEDIVKGNEAVMTALGDLAIFYRLHHGTAFFTEVGTSCVTAVSEQLAEFSEGVGKVVLVKKVEALEVQHREAGGIGNKASTAFLRNAFEREKLYVACGVSASLGLTGNTARADGQGGKEKIH